MTGILIVEDEPQLGRLLTDYLTHAGFSVTLMATGIGVLDTVRRIQPALVLLDVMLPGVDGMTLCRELRRTSDVSIIMVTARVEEIDRLLGLELGADDYICKPFSPREVVARVKAVLRRTSAEPGSQAGISLDPDRLMATVDGIELELTAVEFRLLATLVNKPGRIFTRAQLMDQIYDDHRVVSDRTIDSHIKKLRKKLQPLGTEEELIRSVYGAGYKYDPPG